MFGWHDSGRRDSNRRHGLNHCWSCRNHASSGVRLCVYVSTCTIARSGIFLPAAWLLRRIRIPVCAADMTSQVLELLLKHQIMHPPSDHIPVWRESFVLQQGCFLAGLQGSLHVYCRSIVSMLICALPLEAAGDARHESPS